jgi:hypothetical protein
VTEEDGGKRHEKGKHSFGERQRERGPKKRTGGGKAKQKIIVKQILK